MRPDLRSMIRYEVFSFALLIPALDLLSQPLAHFVPISRTQKGIIMLPVKLPPPQLPVSPQGSQYCHLSRRDELIPFPRHEQHGRSGRYLGHREHRIPLLGQKNGEKEAGNLRKDCGDQGLERNEGILDDDGGDLGA